MASKILKNFPAFTLIESIVAISVFLITLGILTQIIITLTRSAYSIDEYNASLENIRLGLEKIWRELKYGSNFSFSNSNNTLQFYDRNCDLVSVSLVNNNIIFTSNSISSDVFDPNFVEVINWQIETDSPSGGNFYFENSHKIIVISYDFQLKGKTNVRELKIQQSIAPLNSVLTKSPCQN